MKLVDGLLRGYANSADEERSFLLDDDIDELGKLALCIVIICLPSIASNLRDKEVNTEGGVLIIEMALELLDLKRVL